MNKNNYQTPSLMHGGLTNQIREGFTEGIKDPYHETKKHFAEVLGREIQWPGGGGVVDVPKEMNEAIDNYQKLYCLEKGTPNTLGGEAQTAWNFGKQKKKGEPIGTLAGTGNDGCLLYTSPSPRD